MFEVDLQEAARWGVRPHGLIFERSEKDKYDNDVSIIQLADGTKFRMVHHSKNFHRRQRATVYADRGKFIKVEAFAPDDDCMATWISVAGYRVEWGDGDNLGVVNPEGFPDLSSQLRQIHEDNMGAVLVFVLSSIEHVEECWLRKEVQPTQGK
jgi:hypothetical protein